LEDELSYSKDRIEVLKSQRDDLTKDFQATKNTLDKLNSSYDALEQNSSKTLADNSKQNRELIEQLELKESALAKEQGRLEQLQKDLQARSNRIEELQSLIADKEQKNDLFKRKFIQSLNQF